MKKSQRRLFTFSPDTQSTLAALLLLTGGFTMVAVLIYFLATADERISAVVVTSEDIGRLQSARFIGFRVDGSQLCLKPRILRLKGTNLGIGGSEGRSRFPELGGQPSQPLLWTF